MKGGDLDSWVSMESYILTDRLKPTEKISDSSGISAMGTCRSGTDGAHAIYLIRT